MPSAFGSKNTTKRPDFKEVWDNAVLNLFNISPATVEKDFPVPGFEKEINGDVKLEANSICSSTPTIQFNTFHSICYSIVKEVYPNMVIRERNDLKKELPILATYMQQYGVNIINDNIFKCKRDKS